MALVLPIELPVRETSTQRVWRVHGHRCWRPRLISTLPNSAMGRKFTGSCEARRAALRVVHHTSPRPADSFLSSDYVDAYELVMMSPPSSGSDSTTA